MVMNANVLRTHALARLAVLASFAACDTGTPATVVPPEAAALGDPDASADAPGNLLPDAGSLPVDSGLDAWSSSPAVEDAAPGPGFDATGLDAPGPDPAPTVCGADAAEAGVCPMPPSACADPHWLVFYDNAQCVAGSCTWEKRYNDCGPVGCFFGECRPPLTL